MLHIRQGDDSGFNIFGSTLNTSESKKITLLSNKQLEIAIQGGEVVFQNRLNNTPYAVYAKQVLDFSGDSIS